MPTSRPNAGSAQTPDKSPDGEPPHRMCIVRSARRARLMNASLV
jgi:hypothetical protein